MVLMHLLKILMHGLNFIKINKVDFRYIELMQTGDNLDYFKNIIFHLKFLKVI
jgi:hypothetical protein